MRKQFLSCEIPYLPNPSTLPHTHKQVSLDAQDKTIATSPFPTTTQVRKETNFSCTIFTLTTCATHATQANQRGFSTSAIAAQELAEVPTFTAQLAHLLSALSNCATHATKALLSRQ